MLKITEGQLSKILSDRKYVKSGDLKKAEKWAKDNNLSIVDYLLSNNLMTKDLFGQAMSEDIGVVYADLNTKIPTKDQVKKIPENIAKKFRVVLFGEDNKKVVITSDSPKSRGLLSAVKKIFPNKRIVLGYSLPEDIDVSLRHYEKELNARFIKIIKKNKKIAPGIIDEIIKDATVLNASDIHFDVMEDVVSIRFRVDGVLKGVGSISRDYYLNILNRVKVLANLRIDEHFVPQDGVIRYENGDSVIDLRISIVPTIDGEKISIRLLSKYSGSFSLSGLGLSEENQKILEVSSKKPFGMIVVAGPTGSGKTTSLYGVIKNINRPEVNITTIEDPVEYKIEGVNHIQVNKDTNLTFASGLRSIVRQDPDVILVGEIRDVETAEIAVNSALTGHLLFSTFHSNDTATVITRLLGMGIEPFILSSTMELIISQRLVRKICEHCRHSYIQHNGVGKKRYGNGRYFREKKVTLYRGGGCAGCGNSGYMGRTGIFEVIKITPEMRELILSSPSSGQVWELAKKQGSKSLFDDGLEKVKNGITTMDELLRVAMPT